VSSPPWRQGKWDIIRSTAGSSFEISNSPLFQLVILRASGLPFRETPSPSHDILSLSMYSFIRSDSAYCLLKRGPRVIVFGSQIPTTNWHMCVQQRKLLSCPIAEGLIFLSCRYRFSLPSNYQTPFSLALPWCKGAWNDGYISPRANIEFSILLILLATLVPRSNDATSVQGLGYSPV